MKYISYFFAFVILMPSCSKDDSSNLNTENIDLSELKAGQKAEYHRYTTSCADINGDFKFTGDTLIVEVIEQNDELFLKEYVTANSPLYLDGSFDTDVIYPVKNAGQGVIMPERWNSALFFFYANDTLRLHMDSNVHLIQEQCKMMLDDEPFIGNDIGEISSFQIGPVKYNDLTVVSCEPLEHLDAYLIHDDNRLYGSHVIIFDFFNGGGEMVSGWKLVN
jgi:hypothetical protein